MFPARTSAAPLLGLLFAAAGSLSVGCGGRPGYVDSTTGRAYAGFAKPACYGTDFCGTCGVGDLFGVRECDCRRDPYKPPVVAFCSFPGCAAGCRKHAPPYVTTHVHAPMPARYDQFPGHANRSQQRPGAAPTAGPPMSGGPAAVPAPMPLPQSLEGPEDDGLDEPIDPAQLGNPGLPPVGPSGIGE